MSALFVIPLVNVPQRFTIELSGTEYIITSRWNGAMPAWVLDIADATTEEVLIAGLPLVSGIDLLAQHKHVGIPGRLLTSTCGCPMHMPPTLDNLGQDADLYYMVDE